MGDEDFVDEMQYKVLPGTDLSEIASSQKRQLTKPLSYYDKKFVHRTAILKAYESGSYSMKDIGDYYDLHYSRVSRIVRAKSKTWPLKHFLRHINHSLYEYRNKLIVLINSFKYITVATSIISRSSFELAYGLVTYLTGKALTLLML